MKILFVSSEGMPYVKTGGLADVSYALPTQLQQQPDTEVVVFLPLYQSIKQNKEHELVYLMNFSISLAWRNCYCGVFQSADKKRGVTYYFIDNDYYFGNRNSIYGDYDDVERFAFFSKAVLEAMIQLKFDPDIIQCNDWQTALIPLFLEVHYRKYSGLRHSKTVLTIHNIAYQGKAREHFLSDVLGIDDYWKPFLEYDGCLNCMKAGIVMANRLTTVSKTYALEMQHEYFAYGLHHILKIYEYKLQGIINGIDLALFDPRCPTVSIQPFDSDHLIGKQQNKEALQQQLGLAVDQTIPMVAMIGRLVSHKGLDLVKAVQQEMMRLPIQLVVIGTGEAEFEQLFYHMATVYPEKMSANIVFNEQLAMQLYAAADFFLMPSQSEPCGLSQLIAMRYGTIPIVRETGGLLDTVPALNPQTMEGRGFTFQSYNGHDMLGAIERAIHFWKDQTLRKKLIKKLMKIDSSWENSAKEYKEVYLDC